MKPPVALRAGAAWILVAGLSAACAGPAPASPTAVPEPTRTPLVLPTALPETMDCLVVSVDPTATPEGTTLFPPAGQPGDFILGPDTAPITFLEYGDVQSPAVAVLDTVLTGLVARNQNKIRWVYRPFPIPANDKSVLAAAALMAAGKQERFWPMHHLLIPRQEQWSGLTPEEFEAWLLEDENAPANGLDVDQLLADMRDAQVQQAALDAQRQGLDSGIPTVPFLLINGRIYTGPRDAGSLQMLIDLANLDQIQFDTCPPFIIDPENQYLATLKTTRGEVLLLLDTQAAPLAVNNFVFLARAGWYDGSPFHKVLPGQLAQTGDPSGTGLGTPGYAFRDEIGALKFDQPGRVAMANAGANSNGSQFFLTYAALPELDGQYTIFGQVLDGMDVLAALTPRNPSLMGELPESDTILQVLIEERVNQ